MIEALLIIAIVTLVVCVIALFIITHHHSIVSNLYKINVSEQKIDETLKNKEDLMNRAVNIIERQLKLDTKMFEDFKNINSSKLNNYDKDILLIATFNEIKRITEDNESLGRVKSYKGIIKDIEECDILLGGMKSMNNKYVAIYNKDIKKFPKNIIAKVRKYKIKSCYEVKNFKKETDFMAKV